MQTVRRRHAPTAQTAADHLIASRLPADRQAVETALTDLKRAQLSHTSQDEVRRRCGRVLEALDDAVASAEAAYRLATGPLEGLPRTRVIAARQRPAAREAGRVLEQLRITRQRHMLSRSSACGPAHMTGVEPAAQVMPHWPETDYLSERKIYARKVLLPPAH